MALNHRKLLQNSTCSDCGPTCPYKCSYPEFYWPPQPPPTPLHTAAHVSPYVIIILTLLASAFLFFSYYLIMVRCSTRFRRPPATAITGEESDFSDEDRGVEVDHPIWYIHTVGLQPSVINSISVYNYKKHDNLIDGTDCSVCLSEFQDNETLRLLPKCNHAFHIPCIDTWLRSHTTCPLCRAGILSNTLCAGRNDYGNSPTTGLNLHTEMEDLDNGGELGGNPGLEIEICDENEDSKTEYESVTARSISMDSVIEEESGDSTVNMMT